MHSRTFVRLIQRTSVVLSTLSLFCVPFFTHAAVARPTCTLTAETSAGTHTITRKADVLLRFGEEIRISWKSTGATTAERGNGSAIALAGTATHSPSKTSTYSYRFSNGDSEVTCSATVYVVTGEFKESTLATSNTKPTISGTASGTKAVYIQIFKEGNEKSLFSSKSISVKNGEWKTKLTKKLAKGTYDIVLLGDKGLVLNTLSEETLTIGTIPKKSEKITGTLVVVPVSLLTGGIARGGSSIALSYLQVANVSNEATTLRGFTIKQNGSASTDPIVQLSVSDDSGTYRNSVSGNSGASLFKKGTAFIPIEVPMDPLQMRLFTIKGTLINTVTTTHIGNQLKIDVVGVDALADIKSPLPIRGTTWTFGL